MLPKPLTAPWWYQSGLPTHVNPPNIGSQTLRLQRGAAPFTNSLSQTTHTHLLLLPSPTCREVVQHFVPAGFLRLLLSKIYNNSIGVIFFFINRPSLLQPMMTSSTLLCLSPSRTLSFHFTPLLPLFSFSCTNMHYSSNAHRSSSSITLFQLPISPRELLLTHSSTKSSLPDRPFDDFGATKSVARPFWATIYNPLTHILMLSLWNCERAGRVLYSLSLFLKFCACSSSHPFSTSSLSDSSCFPAFSFSSSSSPSSKTTFFSKVSRQEIYTHIGIYNANTLTDSL